MIDLHCHVLWGMDDGADNFEDSLTLCELAVQNDMHALVLTPHMKDLSTLDDFLICRDENTQELKRTLQDLNIPLDLFKGAEVFLDQSVFGTDALSDLTIASSRYILCEFAIPAFSPDRALLEAEEVCNQNLVPIIAHPERYDPTYNCPYFINELKKMGALFQVNSPSLAGRLGERVQEKAKELLLDGTADFMATDAHRPYWRPNRYLKHKESFPEEISEELLTWVTETAPSLVIQNQDVKEMKKSLF